MPPPVYNSDTDFNAIVRGLSPSPTTKTMYTDRIRHLTNKLGCSFFDVVKKHGESIAWIQKNYAQPTSQKAYLSIALAMFRHAEGLREQLPAAYKAWNKAFTEADGKVEDRYKKNAPSDKQAAGYVKFEEIMKKRDALEKGSEERLLLGMYTHLKPLRADFNNVRLYKTLPSKPAQNYIHLCPNKPCVLVLGEYKTAKSHGVFKKELPIPLCEEISASLETKPREYLFVKADGEPFEKSNSFIRYANRTFKRLFGRPMTISLIRHAFINTLDFNKLTIEEKEEIAREMGHTTRLQDQYRLIFKDE